MIGDPGEDVSTCNVDSGGPLFVDQAGVRVVAGITKGAILSSGSCIPPVEAYDTNVSRHHEWIEQTAAALGAIDLSVTQMRTGRRTSKRTPSRRLVSGFPGSRASRRACAASTAS